MVIKLENINSIVQQYIGSTLKYNIQLAIIITQIDDEGDHTPVPYEVKKGIYPNVFDGIKELILGELDNLLNFISVDESGREILTSKQEDNIRTEIIKSLESNEVGVQHEKGISIFGISLKSPVIKFYQECLIEKKTFKTPRTYKIAYQVIVKPEGKTDKLALQTAEERALIPETSTIEDPKNWIILLANNKAGNSSYPKILVSTERSYPNKKWNECQSLLHNEQEFMLTIRQFVDFINLLRSRTGNVKYADGEKVPKEEAERILNEIIEVRTPWRAEWLDARFIDKEGQTHIAYHKVNPEGKITEVTEQLQDCLMEDKAPGIDFNSWLNNNTEHGLPLNKIKNGNLYYRYPRVNSVARFEGNSGRAYLDCNGDPRYSGSRLWVRRAKIFK